jgi:hypothetical protein
MTDPITKPFNLGHADIFECHPEYQEHFRSQLEWLARLGSIDQCGSHIVDGRILYIGGFYETAPGVAEMFIFPSTYIYQYQKTFLKDSRWWVNHLMQQYRRVQCWGEDSELSRRWLTALGFVVEGELRSYTVSGSTMLVWGKV